MIHNPGAEELLRARTLGFYTPRPGRRPAPRQTQEITYDIGELATTLNGLGIDPDSVVRMTKCISRRLVLLVELADGSAQLLKWPDSDTELDNDYEYVMLSLFDRLDFPAQTRAALPRLLAGGPETRVIALDVVRDCDPLSDLIRGRQPVDTGHLVRLAAVFAGLHRTPIAEAYAEYPEWLLWPPVPKTTDLSPYEYAHGCGMEFDVYIRTMQDLAPDFRELHDDWRPDSLVHFDMRDDNILIARDPDSPLPLRIIDWELAGFGDPRYDIGYLVGQFMMGALRRHGDMNASTSAQRNIRTFLTAYRRLSTLERADEERIFQYAGITLLLQASMRLQQLGALNRVGHLCLLYGRRLIQNPSPEVILR
ncbi:phosphotransferase family protein [Streptomyces sp. AC550_RSS872]|uniref:phosphotransferase family protein n=1 Tax=Streptomyces sp. AC550_RSS872 TaxID=2823689 RepID=UPI001C254698|nr:phosphotransferase [Streptomyces sp. AC550_RSS872]